MLVSTWDQSYETGNELIDNQHREVIALLDELRDVDGAEDSDVRRVLDRIMDFTLFHFLAEERLMEEVGYPDSAAREMLEHHRSFKEYARLRVLEFRTVPSFSVLPLHDFMKEFLELHEFGQDKLLADWIRERNGASAARS